ncbi:uncharacterized protein PAC_19264 [Phialocephala subalpina]|uniref:Ubiquitin-like domain-containing protein n=1 Tax=Phialocephala subalpina TaxID=576137 RepID=A0A1L7XWE8_9HELO|nr:uncharacterized protein PAC_19264 [Phialocephala subalpina]
MSFGWSAGDIVAALKLLHQISSAVRDSGGASSEFQDTLSFLYTLSRTLQHLNALQATPLDPDLANNLQEQCDHIRVPLTAFLDDVGRRFGPALSMNSRRKRIFAVPRMIQWTVSDSKKTKGLKDRIAVPMAAVGLMLSQQIIQTTLAMPENIQDRMSHLIDTAVDTTIIPATQQVDNKLTTLSITQASSADTITRSLKEIGTTTDIIHTKSLEGREATTRLESYLERIVISQESFSKANAGLCNKLGDISIAQSASTDIVMQTARQAGKKTENAIQMHALETRAQSSSLHKKLEEVDTSVSAMHSLLRDLSISEIHSNSDLSNIEVERAIQNILGGIWVLLSRLQLLIRELLMLLAPYLIAFYRIKVQGSLQYDDHFMFEDAIGRIKRLPCAQFQHWTEFYDFLLESFKDAPGLSLVLDERFRVMNRYNDYSISKEAWRAVIQPKSKITMAMILDTKVVTQGRCIDLLCSGRVSFPTTGTTSICPVCGKNLSLLPSDDMSPSPNSAINEILRPYRAKAKKEAYPVTSAKDIVSKMGSKNPQPGNPENSNLTPSYDSEEEIAAFKRVMLRRTSEEITLSELVPPQAKCMTGAQRSTVKAALNAALEEGKNFGSAKAVNDFLKDLISEELLSNSSIEIFDCYLSLQEDRTRQLLSPTYTNRSLSNISETSLDGEDTSEKSDLVTPVFESEDRFPISFYRSRFDDFQVLTARRCKGAVSYISEAAVRRHHLKVRRDRTILAWSYTGKQAYTSCEIVSADLTPLCEVALAEECRKEDTEEIDEKEESAVLRLGGTLHAASYEIDVYQTTLATTVDNFKNVESIRRTTLCSRDKGVKLDRQLQEIRDALQQAGKAVNWIPRDMNGNFHLGPRELVAWILTWKKVAYAHEELLGMCSVELAELKVEMAKLSDASKRYHPEIFFFEHVR